MRHCILLDNKISHTDFESWKLEDRAFWKMYVGVEPEYEVIRTDYSDYPVYTDQDGDLRPTYDYLKSLSDNVVSKRGEYGFDILMVMIHEDNWKSPSIWGTAYSYTFGKSALCYCRWDKDNKANTFGTAYHERHHVLDSFTLAEVGIKAEPLVDVLGWDWDVTHGRSPKWEYIRHRENIDSLRAIREPLQQAFQKRKEKHEQVLNLYEQIISLATTLLGLLRERQARKDGIPKS